MFRDVKPGNFVMGLGPNQNCVYLLDFGLSNYFMKDGKHIPYKDDACFRGTHRYASINSHKKIEQSRRDDLEALIHVLIYFLKGGLPWQNLKLSETRNRRKAVAKVKRSISIEELTDGIAPVFRDLLTEVRSLEYTQIPDYSKYKTWLMNCFNQNSYELDYQFDWTNQEPNPNQSPPFIQEPERIVKKSTKQPKNFDEMEDIVYDDPQPPRRESTKRRRVPHPAGEDESPGKKKKI